MIDTINLWLHQSEVLLDSLHKYKGSLQKLSASGEVVWQMDKYEGLPSSFDGLIIRQMAGKVFFEFSLHKYMRGYNSENLSLAYDYKGLSGWVNSFNDLVDMHYRMCDFGLNRVDLGINYHLKGAGKEEYFRALDVRFGRGKGYQVYSNGVFYGSTWMSKKIYDKEDDLRKEIRDAKKKGKVIDMSNVRDLHDVVRFEIGLKRDYLRQARIDNIVSIPLLLDRFEEERKKFMTVDRLKNASMLDFKPEEFQIIQLTKMLGIVGAHFEWCRSHSRASWYRWKKTLRAKGVYLEAIINEDWRGEFEKAAESSEFILEPIKIAA